MALAQATGKAPGWNFHKYLIGRDGKAVAYYPSKATPDGKEVIAAVEKALAASSSSCARRSARRSTTRTRL